MNRQIWTNKKRHLSMTNAKEQASTLFALCGEVENTMHVLFEFARCSEPLWELVGEAITDLIWKASPTARTYRIHAHSAIYNIYVDRFQGSMPVRLWHGKGLNLPQI